MSDNDSIDWRITTFNDSRLGQLRRARGMTVCQRLEALNELIVLSERMWTMPNHMEAKPSVANMIVGGHEQWINNAESKQL